MGIRFYKDRDYTGEFTAFSITSDISGRKIRDTEAILINGKVTDTNEIIGKNVSLKEIYDEIGNNNFKVIRNGGLENFFIKEGMDNNLHLYVNVNGTNDFVESHIKIARNFNGDFIKADSLEYTLVKPEDYKEFHDRFLNELDSKTFIIDGKEMTLDKDKDGYFFTDGKNEYGDIYAYEDILYSEDNILCGKVALENEKNFETMYDNEYEWYTENKKYFDFDDYGE